MRLAIVFAVTLVACDRSAFGGDAPSQEPAAKQLTVITSPPPPVSLSDVPAPPPTSRPNGGACPCTAPQVCRIVRTGIGTSVVSSCVTPEPDKCGPKSCGKGLVCRHEALHMCQAGGGFVCAGQGRACTAKDMCAD